MVPLFTVGVPMWFENFHVQCLLVPMHGLHTIVFFLLFVPLRGLLIIAFAAPNRSTTPVRVFCFNGGAPAWVVFLNGDTPAWVIFLSGDAPARVNCLRVRAPAWVNCPEAMAQGWEDFLITVSPECHSWLLAT